MPTNYSNYFTIDAATGVLTNSAELDREALEPAAKGKIELNITATDQGVPALMTSAAVTVNVEVSKRAASSDGDLTLYPAPTRPDPS